MGFPQAAEVTFLYIRQFNGHLVAFRTGFAALSLHFRIQPEAQYHGIRLPHGNDRLAQGMRQIFRQIGIGPRRAAEGNFRATRVHDATVKALRNAAENRRVSIRRAVVVGKQRGHVVRRRSDHGKRFHVFERQRAD